MQAVRWFSATAPPNSVNYAKNLGNLLSGQLGILTFLRDRETGNLWVLYSCIHKICKRESNPE